MAIQREQVVQTAEKYVSRGKIEPAIREYRKLLSDNPNDINTLNRIGDLYARIQRIDEAVDFFTQIAEQYTTEGFFVKAIAIYKKIIKLDPTRLEVYEKLAELYHKQGLVNEARTQYQVLADYYQKHDNAASAIAIYQKMADLEPNNPTYHVKLAEIYQQQQLIEKAMGEYRVIAEMMIAHGRSQDAAQVYERALDIDSSNIGFINDAVFKLKESGNAAAATRFLSIAVERNPQAGRIARLARIDEPETFEMLESLAVPEPVPAPRPPAAAAPRFTPPPPAAAEEAGEETSFDFADSFDDSGGYGGDLASMMEAAEAAIAPAAPVEAPKAASEEEIELDLDEVFVLDMESDDEPSSLVKPPPGMTGAGLRLGSAWSQGGEEKAAAPAETAAAEEDFPEVEIELDPESELAPAWGLEAFESTEAEEADADGAIFLNLEEPYLPSLESAAWPIQSAVEEPVAAPRIDADFLERTAEELQPKEIERDEDLVSEAEVLAKYGLEDKALERLRQALLINPQNLAAYTLMIQLHMGQARHESVVELANAMARAAGEIGDAQVWPRMRKDLMEAGYRLDGDLVTAGSHAALAEPAEEVVEEPLAEAPFEALPELELDLEPLMTEPEIEPAPIPAPVPPPAPAPVPPAARKKTPSKDIDQMLRGLLDDKPKRPAPRPAPPAPAPVPPPAIAPVLEEPAPPPAPSAPPAAPAQPMMFNPLEIGEMIEQEELDWDDETPAAPAPFQAPPPVTPISSGWAGRPTSLDDTSGGSWLDEADRGRTLTSGAAESLFDDEDDFFDLAAQLEQELSQEDLFRSGEGLLVQPVEQSLEEIVEGFKKGVAEHLSPTDYDTHFNLGIAYREMGLLDEAIGEFQIAAKDDRHLVLCCSMLGLCFLDKGLPELAVKWYRRGLEATDLSEEDNQGLLYDLGCAYLNLDDKASAYKAFVDLYGINNTYRDVVARIEELGRQ